MIWPQIDPARNHLPQFGWKGLRSLFSRTRLMASMAVEKRQTTYIHKQAFSTFAWQLQQLAAKLLNSLREIPGLRSIFTNCSLLFSLCHGRHKGMQSRTSPAEFVCGVTEEYVRRFLFPLEVDFRIVASQRTCFPFHHWDTQTHPKL